MKPTTKFRIGVMVESLAVPFLMFWFVTKPRGAFYWAIDPEFKWLMPAAHALFLLLGLFVIGMDALGRKK